MLARAVCRSPRTLTLPTRAEVGRKGVFEMQGPLQYTFAVGQIPGGPPHQSPPGPQP